MNAKSKSITWGYFLLWLIVAFIGVVVGFTVFFVVMSALGSGGGPIPVFGSSLIMTGCFGTFVALAQWSILRRFVRRSAVWIGATLLGFLICSPILLSMSGGFGPVITAINSFNMSIALGGVLGLTQWLAIHRKAALSTAWVGVSLVGWFLAGWIGMALKSLSWQMGPILYWLGLFFAGALLSALGMMWLFGRVKDDREFAEMTAADRPLWRRIIKLPGTRLGWWSVALAILYMVLLIILSTLSGKVSWGQTAAMFIVISLALCRWAAGIAGLVAVVEKHERSAIVWIAMLPAVYALILTLNSTLREFLGSQ